MTPSDPKATYSAEWQIGVAAKVEVTRWPTCEAGQVLFYRVVGGDHGAWSSNADVTTLLADFFRGKADAERAR
jgi:hypothetical protein